VAGTAGELVFPVLLDLGLFGRFGAVGLARAQAGRDAQLVAAPDRDLQILLMPWASPRTALTSTNRARVRRPDSDGAREAERAGLGRG
jgi:hypothetical protein